MKESHISKRKTRNGIEHHQLW